MSLPTDYDAIGGHDAVARLVDRFYTHMDTLPAAQGIRALHDDDLSSDRHKLTAFLSGFFGGPKLYWQAYGHPALRRRHQHLPIDTDAARQWLLCMRHALDDVVEDAALRRHLLRRFSAAAMHIRNTED